MHFKQIEMIGFKSFADRTAIRLDQGMTAVVGPNGCGKSNILDATRWALGEQSAKQLRGAHMQDVVFNGSEQRAPMGMAEVTLTFDNSDGALPIDFSEVQVTRRVYRSGESEYLINKAPCRLRDIQELFMDTGIGTNAYSMIGQGKISMVLSSKPEDRRYLFEEAAGIIKYKSRKKLALRKLDQAEQNQLRLGDVIAEVQRQMRSLKRQVNAAERHRELTGQLRDLEIRASWLKFTALSAQIGILRTQFTEAETALETDSARLAELEGQYEEMSLKKLEIDRVLHARREGVHELNVELEKIDRQVALIKQQITFSREQRERAIQERDALVARITELEQAVSAATARRESLQAESAELQTQLETARTEYEAATRAVREAELQLEQARKHAVEHVGRRAEAQTAVEKLGVGIQNVDEQLESLYTRQANAVTRHEALVVRQQELRHLESNHEEQLGHFETERRIAEDDLEAINAELQNRQQHRQNLDVTRGSVEARLTSFRELRDSYEGFAAGVKAVMQAKQEGHIAGDGVRGPIGDLLSTRPEYERAIEAALGGAINNIVVETTGAARSAVAYLNHNQAGRVTFLPLDRLQAGTPRLAPQDEGVIGPALDYVDYEARLHPAVAFLLQDAVLVRSLDDALRLAAADGAHGQFITTDGDVVSPNGSVTGGRVQHEGRGLIGRSAEIEQLEGELLNMANAVQSVSAQAETLTNEAAAIETNIEANDTALAAAQAKVNELGVALAGMESENKGLADVLADLTRRRDECSERRQAMEAQRHDVTSKVENMDSAEEALRTEMAEVQRLASEQRHALSVVANELSDLRLHEASLRQRLEEIERDRRREHQALEEAQQEIRKREALTEQLEKDREGLDGEIQMNLERMRALSETKEEAHAKVVQAENEQKRIAQAIEAVEKELKQSRAQVRDAQTRVHELELELRTDEERVGYFQERILTEYNVALSALKEDDIGTDEYDSESRDKMVADIRAQLQRMGEVNLMAIEEFEALEKRHSFLSTQAKDLEQARETLMNVIARCDSTIRAMFLETFDEIANHFRNYFRRLFNGGQARVYLLDEDDPLESGIEIEARPPGKKPQSISLLSGGECAMTAVALLFSIFKAKPSPFCVLDEVDAPLDDANISRFLGLLDEFTDQSQFVIITHNKQTMARADALYGVTQQERGVSQLVSVRMSETSESSAA
jgi:chromosome segregation protein